MMNFLRIGRPMQVKGWLVSFRRARTPSSFWEPGTCGITAIATFSTVLRPVSPASLRPPLKICICGLWQGLEEFPTSSPWCLVTFSCWPWSGLPYFLFNRESACLYLGGLQPLCICNTRGIKPPPLFFFLV